jgi:rhamnulokinase
VARDAKLEDTQIIAACSDSLAAALVALPVGEEENWAYLQLGARSVLGTKLAGPIISDASRRLDFTNEMGYGGSVRFSKRNAGVWILDECRRYWKQTDRELDADVLTHLATSSEPFESLINPNDIRFSEPGEMPLKIQAFCRETNQAVPRKPGPIVRCVLESLALQYRKTLREIERLTGRQIKKLFILGDTSNSLMNHFIANALQIPVTFAPKEATAIGNVMVQAVALGHVPSLEAAREIVKGSFRMDTIVPHAAVWNSAYDRFSGLASV